MSQNHQSLENYKVSVNQDGQTMLTLYYDDEEMIFIMDEFHRERLIRMLREASSNKQKLNEFTFWS